MLRTAFGRSAPQGGYGRLIWATLAASAVIMMVFYLGHAATSSVLYDDAHNANVSKNLAMGFGYSTSYDRLIHFNPEASTGPTILLPAAALIYMFGNQYWVPNLAFALLLFATVIWLTHALSFYFDRLSLAVTATLIIWGVMCFHNAEVGLLGDVPAALLVCTATVLLCSPCRRRATALGAGFVFGLAIESKLFTVLAVLPALILITVDGTARPRERLERATLLCSGIIAPLALWELFQLASTDFSLEAWWKLKLQQYAFTTLWSGLDDAQQAASVAVVVAKLRDHAGLLTSYFHGPLPLLSVALIMALGIRAWPATSPHEPEARLREVLTLLAADSALHLVWWLFFDREGWYRHLLPALIYAAVATSVTAAAIARTARRRSLIVLVLLLAAWGPQLPAWWSALRTSLRPEPRLAALLSARDEMVRIRHEDGQALFVGYRWWVPRDLEYVLPTILNFRDASRLTAADIVGRHIILVHNEFFNWERAALLDEFAASCQETVFERAPFVISSCPWDPAVLGQ